MLTGKCKEAFEKWYLQNVKHYDTLTVFDVGKLNQFNNLPFQMQYGVYLEFFDSFWIYIEVFTSLDWSINIKNLDDWNYNISNGDVEGDIYGENYKTRQEAQIQAIKKANEIFNSK